MLFEIEEWSAADQFGDREYMGRHFYGIDSLMRVIRRGGAVEAEGFYIDTQERLNRLLMTPINSDFLAA